ncbi:hypothetical protein Chor_005181 [Crotalus horridus]
MAALKIGDKLPNVEVYEGDPSNKINLSSLFKGKKGILFGVPGAFTPGCSQVSKSLCGCWLIQRGLLGRFSMVVEDSMVKSLNVEEDGTGLTCSLASNIVSQL